MLHFKKVCCISLLALLMVFAACNQTTTVITSQTTKSPTTVEITTEPPETDDSPSHTLFPPVNLTPSTGVPSTTAPAPETEEPADEREARFAEFLAEYEKRTGCSFTLEGKLTADELESVRGFVADPDVKMVFASMLYEFFTPEEVDLEEIIHANPRLIQEEFPDNPYYNDGAMLKKSDLERIVRDYLGIEITDAMLDKMYAGGVEYLPEFDAYGFACGDFAAFEAEEEMLGYRTSDGKWLVHLSDLLTGGHPVMALLIPTEDGFLIEAGTYFYHQSN